MGQQSIRQSLNKLNHQVFVEWMLQRRTIVLVLIACLTAMFAAFIPRLEFSTSVYDLVVEDIPENTQYLQFKEIFGSEEIIRIVIKCGNIFDKMNFLKIGQLAQEAKKIQGVRRVISLPDIKKIVDPTNSWPLEQFEKNIANVALFQRNLISIDHKTTLITLVLSNDARQSEVIDGVNRLIEKSGPSLALYQIGMPLISQALADFTKRDFLRLPPLAFFMITIMLLVIFRKPAYVLLPLACVFLALIWTFGFIAMTGKALSILTMVVPVFLIAVGTAYCLHIISEHRHNLQSAQTSIQAVVETFTQCSLPTALAVITTGIGLASLFLNRIEGIREFALFACVGMLSFMVLLLTFLPSVLSFRPRPPTNAQAQPSSSGWVQRLINLIVEINLNHQKIAFTLLGILILICLIGMLRLRVETNPVDYFNEKTQVRQNFHDIYQHLSGSFPVNVVIAGPSEDYFENIENLEAIDKLTAFVETLPGVDKAISFTGYLKLVNYASNRYENDYYRLPEESFEVRMLINSFRSMLGKDLLEAFMDSTFARSNILLLTHISSSKDMLDLRQKINAYVNTNFSSDLEVEVTGFGVVISSSSYQLTIGQLKSLSMTMVLVFGIMFMLFLSIKVGLVALLPNLFPIIVNFGVMGWVGIELSMATSLIASVAIGLAVDDTIHYMVRFNRQFKIDLDDRRALRDTLNMIGRPIIYTTMTVSMGFCILMFSSFKPTAEFGTLMVVTMLAALVGDLILLPCLMRHVELVTLWDLVRIKMGRDPGMEIPLFKGLSRAEAHSIIMAGTIKSVPAGQILFYKGEPSDSMYAVISGRFEVIDFDADPSAVRDPGSQTSVDYIHAGDILGEMGLLRSAPRSATVIAREDGELLPINWKVIKRIQWLYPPTVIKLFNNFLRIMCDRVEGLTHSLAKENLVDDLTNLCNRRGFCRILETEVPRARHHQDRLSMYLLQVDLKNGPAEQDGNSSTELVRLLGEKLADNFQRYDTLSRIDNRQFAVLTCRKGKDEETLRRSLEAIVRRVRSEVQNIDFSISLNTADVPLDTDNDGTGILAKTMAAIDMKASAKNK